MQNRTFGSALIVAGTTIGAGMLAMPLTSAEMGFGYTLLLLIGLWMLLSFSALLFVEVYQKAPRNDAGIATLAEQYFGVTGRLLATAASLLLMYALLTAYAIGGGNLLTPFLSQFGEQAETVAIVVFMLILASSVLVGTKVVDGFTRLLFALKLVAFGFILFMMMPLVKWENISEMPLNYFVIISAAPVFFTSFGFHVVIPTINNYLDNDIRRLRLAIIGGTAIPLVAYILWELVTHGVFAQAEFVQIIRQNPTLNGLVEACYRATGSEFISYSVRLFSAFALITSFLGVALALVDCLDDLLQRVNKPANRFVLSLLAFLPVLFFALYYRDFLRVLGYAGQTFVFYGLLLPIGMAWVFRKRHPDAKYHVAGGTPMLIFTFILGLVIINVPFFIEMGWLPKVIG